MLLLLRSLLLLVCLLFYDFTKISWDKKYGDYNVNYTGATTLKLKVKAGEKYKIILMDDEMKPDNALPTLEKLKEIKKFNIPVIVMLNKEKEFIKEHYIKDGFTDYLLKDDLEKELKRIIEKHL